MKKVISVLLLISFYSLGFSQTVYVDEGVSENYNLGIEKHITIPLHTVKTDGMSIPIYLTYDTSGFLVNSVPSSVGFNWKLHAGGTIEKQVNHLVDESEHGWFFEQEQQLPTGYIGDGGIYRNFDVTPDVFTMSMSSGDFIQYCYKKSNISQYPRPFVIEQDGGFTEHTFVSMDFLKLQRNEFGGRGTDSNYQDNLESDILLHKKNLVYSFRKGVKRAKPWDLRRYNRSLRDSLSYTNYYINRVFTPENNKSIDFEYIGSGLNKLIFHSRTYRYQTNSDPRTPPERNDPILTKNYTPEISIEDVSRLEISKILTDKERVIFTYKEGIYHNQIDGVNTDGVLDMLQHQKINLLDEIKIYSIEGKYITGYKFYYTEQTPNQADYEGDLKIKYIIKYAENHKDFHIFKKFNYFYQNRNTAITKDRDVYGYYNNAQNGDCNVPVLEPSCSNRLPNESAMISGMLEVVTNSKGGKTVYQYKENSYEEMYYGGLLIDNVKKYDKNDLLINETSYLYENPEGFGLAIYDDWQGQQGDIPSNIYEYGYWEDGWYSQGSQAWHTYFTKVDPRIQRPYQEFPDYQISSSPYSLLMKAPIVQTLYDNIQVQDYKQIKSGYYYGKITKTEINVVNNQQEKGYAISLYQPSISGFTLRSKLNKIEYYNNSNIKIKENYFNYDIINEDSVSAYSINNFHTNNYQFNFEEYSIFRIKNVLKNTRVINFSNTGDVISDKKIEYSYLNEGQDNVNYNKIKSSKIFSNNIEFNKTINKYFSEYVNRPVYYQGISYQGLEEYINPVIEKSVWTKNDSNWTLTHAAIKEYIPNSYFGYKHKNTRLVKGNETTGEKYTETNYTESYYNGLGELISLSNNEEEYEYNALEEKTATKNISTGINEYYQRTDEYNNLYVDAILTTSETQPTFLRKSFENKDEASVIRFEKAFSGNFVFEGANLSVGNFPTGYKISYWAYTNNKWIYNSYTHTGGDVVISKPTGADYIDELRIQPKNSTMYTFTFNPLIGVTSSLNDRGEGERIEYDLFNRPLFIFDKDYKVLKEYRYNLVTINITN